MPLSRASSAAASSTVPIVAGNLGSSYVLNMLAHDEVRLFGTLNANLALTTTGWKAGTSRAELVLKQDATGSRTLSIDGTSVSIPSAANAAMTVVLDTDDGGATIFASVPGSTGPQGIQGIQGIQGVAGSSATFYDPAYSGVKAESADVRLILAGGANTRPTSGRLEGVKVPVAKTITVTGIRLLVNQTGGAFTAGQNKCAIYSSAGAKLGETGDQSAVWTSTGEPTSMALTGGSIEITGGDGVFVYIVILTVGAPTVGVRSFGTAGTVINANLAAGTYWSTIMGGLTGQTSLPSSITMANCTSSNNLFWAGLY